MSITRRESASAGAISRVAIVQQDSVGSGRRFFTAVRDSDGNLKVIAWTIQSSNGEIVRRGDASAGQVSEIAVADTGVSFATAVSDSDGNLKLIAWSVTSDFDPSNVFRRADASAGAVSKVAITGLLGSGSDSRYATAVIDGDSNLKVIIWDITIANGSNIVRRGSASAGAVSEISIALVRQSPLDFPPLRFATAVRNSDGNLQIIIWDVTDDGEVIRQGDAVVGQASLISVKRVNTDRLLTAVRDGDGNLKAIVWDVTDNGNLIRRGSASAGAVSLISTMSSATAVRDSDGNLKLIDWSITSSGDITRRDSASAGAVDLIATAGSITAVRDGDGNLKLIDWEIT